MSEQAPSPSDSGSGGLEEFWADILSEEPDRVIAAWLSLAAEEQAAVKAHLQTMTTEDGWAEVQRQAAMVALYAIEEEE
jgi:hypothetical protein